MRNAAGPSAGELGRGVRRHRRAARRGPAAHGRDAVAVYIGNPTAHNLAALLYGRVLRALGTSVYSASTVDQMPKQVSAGLMFGAPLSVPCPTSTARSTC